jgi:hypothetical protein
MTRLTAASSGFLQVSPATASMPSAPMRASAAGREELPQARRPAVGTIRHSEATLLRRTDMDRLSIRRVSDSVFGFRLELSLSFKRVAARPILSAAGSPASFGVSLVTVSVYVHWAEMECRDLRHSLPQALARPQREFKGESETPLDDARSQKIHPSRCHSRYRYTSETSLCAILVNTFSQ